jgi:hypothetical protein
VGVFVGNSNDDPDVETGVAASVGISIGSDEEDHPECGAWRIGGGSIGWAVSEVRTNWLPALTAGWVCEREHDPISSSEPSSAMK